MKYIRNILAKLHLFFVKYNIFLKQQTRKKKHYSVDWQIYLNHMKNIGQPQNTRWRRARQSLTEPTVIIPLIVGLITGILTIIYKDDYFLVYLFGLITTFAITISANHFSNYYSKQEENMTLRFKAETTVRYLNNSIKSILRKHTLDDKDKNLIDTLTDTINYWKDYYPESDTSQIETLKRLRREIKEETNNELKHKKEIELLEFEEKVSSKGLDSYIPLSGGTEN